MIGAPAAWALVPVAVIAAVALLSRNSPPSAAAGLATSATVARAQVDKTLAALQTAWSPRQRERLLEEGAALAQGPGRARTLQILGGGHALRSQAALVAARTDDEELHSVVRELCLAGELSGRSELLVATEQLEPWGEADLVGLLGDADSQVAVTAFEILARREQRPWMSMLELLPRLDFELQLAAARAFPADLDAVDRQRTIDWAWQQDEPTRAAVAWGLRHCAAAEPVRGFLRELLAGGLVDPAGALAALAQASEPLVGPSELYAIAGNDALPVATRALALRILERTRSFDDLPQRVAELGPDPWLRYWAARCLLSAGDVGGAHLLLDIAAQAQRAASDQTDSPQSLEAVTASRALLGRLSGCGPDAPPSAYAAWVERLEALPAQRLPDPAREPWPGLE